MRTHSARFLGALRVIAETFPLYWPMHPRTRARVQSGHIELPPRIHVLDPLGYLDFLCLEARSSIVLTDSGGIQEETTALGVDCLTLRDNTERPSTIELGTNRLAGTHKESILAAWEERNRIATTEADSPNVGRPGRHPLPEVLRAYFSVQPGDGATNGSGRAGSARR